MDNQNANTRNDLLLSEVDVDKIEASLNDGILTGTVNIIYLDQFGTDLSYIIM